MTSFYAEPIATTAVLELTVHNFTQELQIAIATITPVQTSATPVPAIKAYSVLCHHRHQTSADANTRRKFCHCNNQAFREPQATCNASITSFVSTPSPHPDMDYLL